MRRPTERRTELLDAAEHLFAERGVTNTTIADVTSAAGVSKGSFYGYFASRDELVEALNARLGDELFAVMDDALLALIGDEAHFDAGRVGELLELAVDRMIRTLLARRDLIEVWSREPTVVGGSVQWLTRFVDRLAPWVGPEGSGVITSVDPTTTALLVVHGIFGAVLQAILAGGAVDVDGLVTSAQELATRAFGLPTTDK